MAAHASRPRLMAHSHGPSALGGDARRFWELTLTLARAEFKLRYFGSVLGYLWSLMRPLLFFGVLYLFFTVIIDVGAGVPHYGVYLLTSIVLWTYLVEATSNAVTSLVNREALLRKIRFPRMVIPLSVSLTATFNLAMNFIAVIVFALANGVMPRWSWLELVPIALGFVIFATGIGMFLSAAYVRFRDVSPIWEVLVQAWFYATPIMYIARDFASHKAISYFGRWIVHVAMINPPATLLTQMGHALIGGSTFRSAPAIGGTAAVIGAIVVLFAVFAAGWLFFTREAPRVAENL
jgi:ABC-2 type transport system permease protein